MSTHTQIPSHILPTPSPPPEPIIFYSSVKPSASKPEKQQYVENSVAFTVTKKRQQQSIIKSRPSVSRWLNIIQKFLKELDGRDKLMKIVQYFIKILLHYHLVKAKHWSTITSHFSMTRKLLRLGTAIGPMREIAPFKSSIKDTLILSNAIVNNISDDVFCLYKLGVFGSYLGKRSEMISAYCWFAGIFIDIKENVDTMNKLQQLESTKKNDDLKLEQTRQKIFMIEVSIIKLLMDGVFCGKFLILHLFLI
jgi:hypothetical protein